MWFWCEVNSKIVTRNPEEMRLLGIWNTRHNWDSNTRIILKKQKDMCVSECWDQSHYGDEPSDSMKGWDVE
jgi:hypothetical protein